MKLSAFGYLLIAFVVVLLWAGFASFRWMSASARCDARIAEAKADASEAAREHFRQALEISTSIITGERQQTAGELAEAAAAVSTRAAQIARTPTTGRCVMPPGLPSLQPAVEEARNAARD